MAHRSNARPDVYAGGLISLIGLGTIVEATSYDIGSLTEMGPGFLPMGLGVILTAVGALIAAGLSRNVDEEPDPLHAAVGPLDRRGGLAIVAGVLAFIVFGEFAGLVPAIFGCVFISAMGDRTTTWKGASLLALMVTVLGAAVFVYGLKVPFPLFRGLAR